MPLEIYRTLSVRLIGNEKEIFYREVKKRKIFGTRYDDNDIGLRGHWAHLRHGGSLVVTLTRTFLRLLHPLPFYGQIYH